ncbi:MAG TPA: hypothetical protein DCR46_03110 [Cytophagales bacterium]|nr:hypothetical protein [Cytophagales bacterium]
MIIQTRNKRLAELVFNCIEGCERYFKNLQMENQDTTSVIGEYVQRGLLSLNKLKESLVKDLSTKNNEKKATKKELLMRYKKAVDVLRNKVLYQVEKALKIWNRTNNDLVYLI